MNNQMLSTIAYLLAESESSAYPRLSGRQKTTGPSITEERIKASEKKRKWRQRQIERGEYFK